MAALLAGGCVSGTDIAEIQHQLGDLQEEVRLLREESPSRDEIAALTQIIGDQSAAVLQAETEATERLDRLSEQLQDLQARLADTNYRLADLSQKIAATNEQLKSASAPPVVTSDSGGTETVTTARPDDPQALYQSAYNDYLRGNYDLAIVTFRQYLDLFPDTDLADNASYWIGECYFNKGDFRQAVEEFETIAEKYPRSDKKASALLKNGYAYLEMGNRSRGLSRLRRVVSEFPGSDEANLAAQRIRTLGEVVESPAPPSNPSGD